MGKWIIVAPPIKPSDLASRFDRPDLIQQFNAPKTILGDDVGANYSSAQMAEDTHLKSIGLYDWPARFPSICEIPQSD